MQLTFERVGFPRATRFVVLLSILVLALALAAVALVGSRRQVAPPFGPAANGHMAYGTQSGDIVSVDPATAEATVLVGGAELDSAPVYSRDGSRLAFVRAVGGGQAVFAVDSAGGTAAQLTTSPHLHTSSIAWSPDGARIAFEDGGRVWVTSTDGTGPEVQLPLGEASAAYGPVWRPPSGDEILFKGCQGGQPDTCQGDPIGDRLFLTAADGSGAPTAISSEDPWDAGWDFTAFDPTGGQIVTQRLWDGVEGVTVLTLDPGSRQVVEERRALNGPEDTVVDGVEPKGPYKFGPRLSPDGTRVAVLTSVVDNPDHFRVGVGKIEDPHSLVLTGPEFVGMGWTLAWAPDGASLLVMHESGRWILDPAGGPAIKKPWIDVVGDDPNWQRTAP